MPHKKAIADSSRGDYYPVQRPLKLLWRDYYQNGTSVKGEFEELDL